MKCHVCGCSHLEPCEPPCAWVQGWHKPLCTSCLAAAEYLRGWLDEVAVRPKLYELLALVRGLKGKHRREHSGVSERALRRAEKKYSRPVKVEKTLVRKRGVK